MIKARHQWLFIPDIEKKKRTYELRLGYESRLSTSHSKAFLGASVLVQGCGKWSVRVLPIGRPKLSRFDLADGSFVHG
jgi:hypothetical protein